MRLSPFQRSGYASLIIIATIAFVCLLPSRPAHSGPHARDGEDPDSSGEAFDGACVDNGPCTTPGWRASTFPDPCHTLNADCPQIAGDPTSGNACIYYGPTQPGLAGTEGHLCGNQNAVCGVNWLTVYDIWACAGKADPGGTCYQRNYPCGQFDTWVCQTSLPYNTATGNYVFSCSCVDANNLQLAPFDTTDCWR
jgi:hypothetical protein